MPRSAVVFPASIKGQAESDVRGCEVGVTFQCFYVRLARFAFFALLVQRESGDVALLRAGWVWRIGNRARCGLEIRIVVDWRIGSIAQQHAPVVALERQFERLTRSGNVDTSIEDFCRI